MWGGFSEDLGSEVGTPIASGIGSLDNLPPEEAIAKLEAQNQALWTKLQAATRIQRDNTMLQAELVSAKNKLVSPIHVYNAAIWLVPVQCMLNRKHELGLHGQDSLRRGECTNHRSITTTRCWLSVILVEYRVIRAKTGYRVHKYVVSTCLECSCC